MFVKRSCKPELFPKDSDSELEEEIDILTDEGSNVANWNIFYDCHKSIIYMQNDKKNSYYFLFQKRKILSSLLWRKALIMGQHQQTNRQQRIIIDQQHQIQTTRIQGVPGIHLIHTTYPKEMISIRYWNITSY